MAHIHELYDFTVSFLVVHPTERKILLHYHRNLHFWTQLGGHIELDENPMQALERELEEEAGLKRSDYDIVQTNEQLAPQDTVSLPTSFGLFVYDYADTGHKHIDMPYIIKAKTEKIVPADGESKQIDWFTIEQVNEMNTRGLVEDGIRDICAWVLNKTTL